MGGEMAWLKFLAAVSATVAAVLIVPSAPEAQVIPQPPCCQRTLAGEFVLEIYSRPPDETYDETSQWVRHRLRTDRTLDISAIQASIEAECVDGCAPRLTAASRAVQDERAFREAKIERQDTWLQVFVSILGGVAGGVLVTLYGKFAARESKPPRYSPPPSPATE